MARMKAGNPTRPHPHCKRLQSRLHIAWVLTMLGRYQSDNNKRRRASNIISFFERSTKTKKSKRGKQNAE
eukprot:5659754-Prymnesium_polylepis.1